MPIFKFNFNLKFLQKKFFGVPDLLDISALKVQYSNVHSTKSKKNQIIQKYKVNVLF